MVSELDRFETLLNDLLEISRHDAGVAELSVEAVDLRATVSSARQRRAPGQRRGIELLVDMPDYEVIAEVDARRVERILRNLIANAIDHAEHKPVHIRMATDEDTVAVTVRDYGVGLRPGEGRSVQPVLAVGPVAGAPVRRHRAGTGDQHRGRPAAPGPAGGVGRAGQRAILPADLPLVRGHKVTTSPLPMKPTGRTPGRPAPGKTCDPPPADHPHQVAVGLVAVA